MTQIAIVAYFTPAVIVWAITIGLWALSAPLWTVFVSAVFAGILTGGALLFSAFIGGFRGW